MNGGPLCWLLLMTTWRRAIIIFIIIITLLIALLVWSLSSSLGVSSLAALHFFRGAESWIVTYRYTEGNINKMMMMFQVQQHQQQRLPLPQLLLLLQILVIKITGDKKICRPVLPLFLVCTHSCISFKVKHSCGVLCSFSGIKQHRSFLTAKITD